MNRKPEPQHGVAYSIRVLVSSTLCLLATASLFVPRGFAQSADLVVGRVEPNNRVLLTGHHPAWATAQNDVGAVPADVNLGQLELVLARTPQQQQAFDQLLKDQQDPTSPNYHQWLTPTEIGQRFGASQHDLDAITSWLQSQSLQLVSIANSRVRIQFSGPASAVANAFGAEMHYYSIDGEQRFSISAEPQIPAALAGIVKSIDGLYTVKIAPSHVMGTAQALVRSTAEGSQGDVNPDFTGSTGVHYIFPADFAKIYDVNNGSITGAGQTIAVIGRSRVYQPDIANFQSLAGLAQHAQTEIIPPNGIDPGPAASSGGASGDQGEATLDVTRTTSIAPGATIDLVVSSNAGGGISIASEYVVDTDPVPAHIMTISFGACESATGAPGVSFWDSLFAQASAEGISVFVSSGDSAAAGCDTAFVTPPSSQFLSPNYICSSSHATCVGGTEFADAANPNQYWATSNGTNFVSALGYIPEGGWNDPQNTSGQPVVAGSGGGVSAFIPTPPWQTGTGVPGTAGRYTPDIAFSASTHDGYFGCVAASGGSCVSQNGSFPFVFFGGTSAAAPDMAGIAALLNQSTGTFQGELNSILYRLAVTPSNNVFHDVTVASSAVTGCVVTTPSLCNNSTPSPTSQTGGLSGFLVGTGFDEVTGLGSIDVGNLLTNWNTGLTPTTTTVVSSQSPILVGSSVKFTATVTTATGTPTGTVEFLDSGSLLGSGTLAAGMATLTTSALLGGTRSITARYQGDSTHALSVSPIVSQVETLKATTTAVTSSLNPSIGGETVTFTATVSSSQGGTPTGTVTFLDGTTSLGTGTLNATGVTTFPSPNLAVGTHSITAAYSGDPNFAASTSTVLSQVAATGKANTTAVTSSANPSAFNQSVTFTATVSTALGGTPTGTVKFLDGVTSLGVGTLSAGVTTFTTSSLAIGSHSITAQYNGDSVFAPTVSSAVAQVVSHIPSTTALISSVNPSAFTQSVTLKATVSGTGGTPTGIVTFLDGTTTLGLGTLSGAVATYITATLAVGTHSITANYDGDANFAASVSTVVMQVVSAGKATTTTLVSSLNPSAASQSVTFTATVNGTGGTPTGTVTFLDGSTALGPGTLISGVANFTTTTLIPGTHSITASYGGDANFAVSASPSVSQVVNGKATTIALVSSFNPSAGQSVTFTATVSGTGGTPTGTVKFSDGTTSLGTLTLNAGVATFVATTLVAGTHSITASYNGDSTFSASTSSAVSQVVNVAGFAAVTATPTVTAGQNTTVNLTLYQATGSNLTFALSCTSLPSNSSCTFAPSSTVTPTPAGTAVQLTFQTASSELPARPSDRNPWPWGTFGIIAVLASALMAGMIKLQPSPRRRLAFCMCLAVLAMASALAGCGASYSAPPYTGTPKGAAAVTVTGTSGTTTISTPVTITVQ